MIVLHGQTLYNACLFADLKYTLKCCIRFYDKLKKNVTQEITDIPQKAFNFITDVCLPQKCA